MAQPTNQASPDKKSANPLRRWWNTFPKSIGLINWQPSQITSRWVNGWQKWFQSAAQSRCSRQFFALAGQSIDHDFDVDHYARHAMLEGLEERNLLTAEVSLFENQLIITDVGNDDSHEQLNISFADGEYTVSDVGGLSLTTSIAGSSGSGSSSVVVPQGSIHSIIINVLGGNDSVTIASLPASLGGNFYINNSDGDDLVIIDSSVVADGNIWIDAETIDINGPISTSDIANVGFFKSGNIQVHGDNVQLDADLRTGNIDDTFAASNNFTSGDITISASTTLAGAGFITTGSVRIDNTIPSYDNQATSGSISITGLSSSAIQLSRITTGDATVLNGDGGDSAATGSIRLLSQGGDVGSTGAYQPVAIGAANAGAGGTNHFGLLNLHVEGGDIFVESASDLTTGDIGMDSEPGDQVNLRTTGSADLTIGEGSHFNIGGHDFKLNAAGSLNLIRNPDTLRVRSLIAEAGSNINVNSAISVHGGDTTLAADNDILFSAMGSIFSGQSASVSLTANDDSLGGGGITMADGSSVDAESGNLDLMATDNISVGWLNSTATLTIDSGIGAILDSDGGADLDIAGNGTVSITAGRTIGTDGDPLEIDAFNLSLDTATNNGDIFLSEATITNLMSTQAGTGTLNLQGGRFHPNGPFTAGAVNVSAGTIGGGGAMPTSVTTSNTATVDPGFSTSTFDVPAQLWFEDFHLGAGTDLRIVIKGTNPGGAGHSQIIATGDVSLEGNLDLVGSYTPNAGDEFIIVKKTGSEASEGEFAGHPEGTEVASNFLGSGQSAFITYAGGDGNDVAIIMAESDPVVDVPSNMTEDDFTFKIVGGNVVFSDSSSVLYNVPTASVDGQIVINGEDGVDDTLTIDLTGLNEDTPLNIVYHGGDAGNDTLEIIDNDGDTEAEALQLNFETLTDGSIDIDVDGNGVFESVISYTGLEPIDAGGITATDVTLTYSAAAEVITVTDAGDGDTRVDSTVGETVTFAHPTGTLTINAGDSGVNTINIDSLASNYPAHIDINGGNAGDTVNVNGPIDLADNKSLYIAAQTINLPHAASEISTGGNGSVRLFAARNIEIGTEGASIATAAGPITLAANAGETFSGVTDGIQANGASITTDTGAISLTGFGGMAGGTGINLLNGTVISSDSGNITLTGSGQNGDLGGHLDSSIQSTSGDIEITVDTIILDESATLGSNGNLIIQPPWGTTIGLGDISGTLKLNATALGTLQDGFNSITIGSSSAGLVRIADATFSDPLTVLGTSIEVGNGFLDAGTDTITLDAPTITTPAETAAGPMVRASDLIVNGDLGPGAATGVGTFAVEGNITFSSNARLAALVDVPSNDQLVANGDVNLAGARLVLQSSAAMPNAGQALVLIDNRGSSPITGTFAGRPEGHTFNLAGTEYRISYLGGDGNDVVLAEASAADNLVRLDASGNLIVEDLQGAADNLTIVSDGSDLVITRDGGTLSSTVGTGAGSSSVRVPASSVTGSIQFILGDGADVVTVDHRGAFIDRDISIDGGNPTSGTGDKLAVIGDGIDQAIYTPDPATPGQGSVETFDVGSSSASMVVSFTGLEPVDVSGMAIATLMLLGDDDDLYIENGFDFATGGTMEALQVSGTSGGVAIEQVAFFNNTTVRINTTANDGNDTIELVSASNGHGNTNLEIATGENNDIVRITGAASFAGNVSVHSQNIVFGAGAAITASGPGNVVLDAGNGELTMVDTAAVNAGSGTIAINAAQDIAITGLVTNNETDTAVMISSTNGEILDGGETAIDVTSLGRVTLDALRGIGASGVNAVLETAIDRLNASVLGSGNIAIGEIDAITLEEVDTLDGEITIEAIGVIMATDVNAGGSTHADVNLMSTSGGIVATAVNAADAVTLTAALGDITVGTIRSVAGPVSLTSIEGRIETEPGLTIDPELQSSAVASLLHGHIAPGGTDPGVLDVDGNLTFVDGGSYSVNIDGDLPGDKPGNHDQITVSNGDFNIGSGVKLSIDGSFLPSLPTTIVIIDNLQSSNTVTGEFLDKPDDTPFFITLGGRTIEATIDYNAGPDQNDVIVDLSSGPLYDFSFATYSVNETNTNFLSSIVTVTRTIQTTIATSVDVVLAGNTATAGSDFKVGPITLDFAAGETSKTVPIEIVGDLVVEPDQTIVLSLTNFSDNGMAGTSSPTSTLTIIDDDVATLSLMDMQIIEPDSGSQSAVVFAALDKVTEQDVTVGYQTLTGSATAGIDFVAKTSTFTIPAGRTAQSFPIEILGDTTSEMNEMLTVQATSAATGGTVLADLAFSEIMILDNDNLKVVDVKVGSTDWSAAFKADIDPVDGFGYSIPTGSQQTAPLPWANINQIRIRFSQDISGSFEPSLIGLGGFHVPDYRSYFSSVIYNPALLSATITLNSFLGDDQLLLAVSDLLTTGGKNLDGEWTTGQPSRTSGDGVAGGNFEFRFDVLPGDVNQSGTIRSNDGFESLRRQFQDIGSSEYMAFADIDGNGQIRSNDGFFALAQQFGELSKGTPNAPSLPFSARAAISDRVLDELFEEENRAVGRKLEQTDDDMMEDLLPFWNLLKW